METNLKDIFNKFDTNCKLTEVYNYGSGHINDTYRVDTGDTLKSFILQRINHRIFRDVPMLQKNIERVTRHLETKILGKSKDIHVKQCLSLISTKQGASYHQDEDGNYWRVYPFILNSISYDKAPNIETCYQGGIAYGEFSNLLSDLEGGPLHETIPDFHDIHFRFKNFEEALQTNYKSRADKAISEINFIFKRIESITEFYTLKEKGVLKKRVSHNDTKLNNVLFQKDTGKSICVIDLDTVMTGIPHFDYGDAIRTMANTALEDESNVEKVSINEDFFEWFTKGYIKCTSNFLTPLEIAKLPEAARYMCFIIGLRFITDYLQGDTYFKTKYNEHNLVRARVQLKLVEEIEKKQDKFEEFVSSNIRI